MFASGFNTTGPFLYCKEAANGFNQGGGRTICLSTSLVAVLWPGFGVNVASKAVVEVKELRRTGIMANCMASRPVATNCNRDVLCIKDGRVCEGGGRGVLAESTERDVARVVGFLVLRVSACFICLKVEPTMPCFMF
ncbi:hypothetical protein F0562_025342 [Nyssa sinensis]|uniref:Uncharacterized protein n=1 Tax=Nyssa sinensis TaxID=561372 RepID=A0A5J5BFE5_9ASTE|nr:hypothetical protein F0562_025342 [Nyssa sinensis]